MIWEVVDHPTIHGSYAVYNNSTGRYWLNDEGEPKEFITTKGAGDFARYLNDNE